MADDRDKTQQTWQERIEDAFTDRRRFEPVWHEALAFVAGKQWLEWSHRERRMIAPPEQPLRDLYTADRVTEYRMTALGEIAGGRDRPELLLARQDEWSEQYQEAANKALEHAWRYETDARRVLAEKDRTVIDLGTAAIRCRFDPTRGKVVRPNWPHIDGRPVYGDEAVQAVSEAVEAGRTLEHRDVREGQIVWEHLSPFNLLVPPGIPHEKDFPWEVVVRPVLLDEVQALYPAAAGLVEDRDIMSLYGIDVLTESSHARGYPDVPGSGQQQRLKGYVWLFTGYERPCRKYPKGQTVVLAGADRKLLEMTDKLPYVSPSGERRPGIAYFHWWRQGARFWSRGLVEAMMDGQRRLNRRTTQVVKTIDRGQPKVFVTEDSIRRWPTGMPLEVVELAAGAQVQRPDFFPGIGPGDWMYRDMEQIDGDLAHATGFYGPSRGENPENVTTYSQLALIAENDQTKREPIYDEHKESERLLVEDTVYDIRTYWGPEKRVLVTEDDEDLFRAEVFNATTLPDPEQSPDFYRVKVASGSAKPRTQGAMLQLVVDLKTAALESGVFQGPEWLAWFRDSMEAGQPLDFPEVASSEQAELAELENHLLLEGETVPVFYFQPAEVHIPIHRHAQTQALLTGDAAAYDAIEQHVLLHLQAGQENAMRIAQEGGGTMTTDEQAAPQPVPEPEFPGVPA